MNRISRRKVLVTGAATAAVAGCGGPPAPERPADPLLLNDASRLNPTRVVSNDAFHGDGAIEGLRTVLAAARADGRPVAVGGARHSMGGQSLPNLGHAVSLDGPVGLSREMTYRTSAGARWRDVVVSLDRQGLSPAVMQSNDDFAVGGAISVNAHGWAVPCGPVGSTVSSFRMMTADGEVRTCSRKENADLFRHAIGGYGLFGVLIDAKMGATANATLVPKRRLLEAEAFGPAFIDAVGAPDAAMAYGRLSLHRKAFLREALLVDYRVDEQAPREAGEVRPTDHLGPFQRELFRGQAGSDAGKARRWWAETTLGGGGKPVTRNALLSTSVKAFAGRDRTRTDILHEYFVPPEGFEAFLKACRKLIPASNQDLLNVTLRWVEANSDSVLAFAPGPRIALVMYFTQAMTAAAEADMAALTQKLIDAALEVGGSFYLPYRLHARPDQLRRAYPAFEAFLEAKRRLDPKLIFRNRMWDAWTAR